MAALLNLKYIFFIKVFHHIFITAPDRQLEIIDDNGIRSDLLDEIPLDGITAVDTQKSIESFLFQKRANVGNNAIVFIDRYDLCVVFQGLKIEDLM